MVDGINRSSNMNYRFAVVGENKEDFITEFDLALSNEELYSYNANKIENGINKIAFLFTGQGSIYINIAKQFYTSFREFRETFDLCEKSFGYFLQISISEAVFGSDEELLRQAIYSQPIIFSVEYSLTKVWDALGIKPDVVIGHSIGEFAAACYAGLLTFEDAVKMIAWRGKMMMSATVEGKIVGVLTDVKSMEDAISDSGCKNVSIAAINAPQNVTLSGIAEEVNQVITTLHKSKRTFVNDLGIKHPFHSVVMEQFENEYRKNLEDINFNKLNISMISCVTGKLEHEDVFGNTRYWAEHLSKTVNFQAAAEEASRLGINVFVEIGGNATLSRLAAQCIENENVLFLPSLRNGTNDYKQLFDSVKALYQRGININWDNLYSI